MLERGYAVCVIPRLHVPVVSGMHDRYYAIRGAIDLVNFQGAMFSLSAFLIGCLYGGQIRPRIRLVSMARHFRNAVGIAKHYIRLASARPDVLITHFAYDNAVASSLYSQRNNVKNILWMHGSDIHTVPHRSLKWITNNCAAIVTNSMHSRRLIRELGIDVPIHVSSLGVNLSRFDVSDNADKHVRPVIICVARLGHGKDHMFLLRVFALVKKALPKAELWLVGDGPNREKLEQYVCDLNIQDVVFHGNQPQETVSCMLRQSWVCVLFSDMEGLGVALLEAHASGVPCLCNSVGGMPEVVSDEETGFVIDKTADDAERSAADRCVQLLSNDELRKTMGEKARSRAESHFSEDLHFEMMDRLVKQITAR
nr:glycosyltransferase family 4 protein [Methylococcus sp. EFPC2]